MSNDAIGKITQQIQKLETSTASMIQNASAAALARRNDEGWSALDYFKHVLLSVKPVVKAGELPKETLIKSFGASARKSDGYAVVVEKYDKRLRDGIRAEDAPSVIPRAFRIPADVTDEKAYLLAQWADTHQRLYQVVDRFASVDLDMVQLPHPAIGLITFREMLYFTIYHNTLHWHDMKDMIQQQ